MADYNRYYELFQGYCCNYDNMMSVQEFKKEQWKKRMIP